MCQLGGPRCTDKENGRILYLLPRRLKKAERKIKAAEAAGNDRAADEWRTIRSHNVQAAEEYERTGTIATTAIHDTRWKEGVTNREVATAEGFSVTVNGLRPVGGFCVSPYKDRERAITAEMTPRERFREVSQFAKDNLDLLQQKDHVIGGWYDSESKTFYLDVTVVMPNAHQAREIAKDHNQLAFYDVAGGEEVRPTEKGKAQPTDKGKAQPANKGKAQPTSEKKTRSTKGK